MGEISVEELAQWRANGKPFVLLDVREPVELTLAALPQAVHIPMREIPTRVTELDPATEFAVICHHGGRSAQVAKFLTQRGFTRVHNVHGGIDAYAKRVDQSIPRY
ncbi:MAG TPA: rhodanese-like domain-containing protein [Candidatus Baltobacteraceae bacterium]